MERERHAPAGRWSAGGPAGAVCAGGGLRRSPHTLRRPGRPGRRLGSRPAGFGERERERERAAAKRGRCFRFRACSISRFARSCFGCPAFSMSRFGEGRRRGRRGACRRSKEHRDAELKRCSNRRRDTPGWPCVLRRLGLGFGVWGLGFGVWGLGFGFRVEGWPRLRSADTRQNVFHAGAALVGAGPVWCVRGRASAGRVDMAPVAPIRVMWGPFRVISGPFRVISGPFPNHVGPFPGATGRWQGTGGIRVGHPDAAVEF